MGNGLLAGKHEKTPSVREISTYIWMQLAGNHILTTFEAMEQTREAKVQATKKVRATRTDTKRPTDTKRSILGRDSPVTALHIYM